jgi:hypothetical protein
VAEIYAVKAIEKDKDKEGKEAEPLEGTSETFAFNAADVISAECVIGDKVPTEPCAATLQLSTDGTTWLDASRKGFGYLQPAKTYRVAWALSEFETASSPQMVSAELSGGWEQMRIKFTGCEGLTYSAHSALGTKPPEKKKEDHSKSKAADPHSHAVKK